MRSNTEHARILVVDDEPDSRRLFERAFMGIDDADYDVISVDNGQAALELMETQPFDVVLLDVMLPGMTGFEVLEHARSNPYLRELPIIMITGATATQDVVTALKIGANDYLSKPIDIDIVRARVNLQIEHKRLNDERKNAIDKLQLIQTLHLRLFRMASHDMQSPLNTLQMTEFALRNTVGDQSDAAPMLDVIHHTVGLMQALVKDYLDLAALQSGALAITPEPTHLEHALLNVVMQFSYPAQAKEVAIVPGHLGGTVMADAVRLEQIVGNLVSNAIKYTTPGSTVQVWTEELEDRIRLCVADEGPGIPEADRPLLFQEFSKLKARPTNGERSTGLGLWIVHYLVTLHHGEVGVECPEDGGSIFWVELPRHMTPEEIPTA